TMKSKLPSEHSSAAHAIQAGLREDREGFKFRSGRLSLDFVATVAARRKPVPRELLETPQDLDRWLKTAGVPVHTRKSGLTDLVAARELREALYRLAQACLQQQLFAPDDRKLVNRWAATRQPPQQLGLRPGFAVPAKDGVDLMEALATIARDGVELFSGPQSRRIRNCERDGCSLLFVDSSRSRRRRWCSMSACGNKEKVAAHRRRHSLPAAGA
ncbi:MAG: ABATE domain-containing protein, partial [Thermoanaerobaculia bacterium]